MPGCRPERAPTGPGIALWGVRFAQEFSRPRGAGDRRLRILRRPRLCYGFGRCPIPTGFFTTRHAACAIAPCASPSTAMRTDRGSDSLPCTGRPLCGSSRRACGRCSPTPSSSWTRAEGSTRGPRRSCGCSAGSAACGEWREPRSTPFPLPSSISSTERSRRFGGGSSRHRPKPARSCRCRFARGSNPNSSPRISTARPRSPP